MPQADGIWYLNISPLAWDWFHENLMKAQKGGCKAKPNQPGAKNISKFIYFEDSMGARKVL